MYRAGSTVPVTESEQVKAALAALAEGEAEHSDGTPAQREVSDVTRAQGEVFEWGGDETGASARPACGADPADYRTVIERAVAATEDIEAAAAFVESVGLDGLESAVEQAEREVSGLAAEGREALATFERYRVAAQGPVDE